MTPINYFHWARPEKWLLSLLLVALLAAGLRCFRLERSVLSADESFSWRLAQYPLDVQIRRTAVDVHPPLYYLLLKTWFGAWGLSPLALRSFSVFWGVFGVLMIYAVCVEAYARNLVVREHPPQTARQAALFCACLYAIHLTQITPARSARMYSLGVFLAGLTAWLLLRALHVTQRGSLWWSAYGLAVAAFCYTHNYAFFTILAQTVFFVGETIIRWKRTSLRGVLPSVRGFVFAAFLAFILYSPWLPILLSQMREVRQNYWIPPVPFQEAERVFFVWGMGITVGGNLEMHLWLGIVIIAIFWVVWRADRAGVFFLLQALLPWVCALGISTHSGRSIFVERYFAFAHLAFLGWLGTLWCYLPSWRERLLFSCLFVIATCYGLWAHASRLPSKPPAVELAATFLKSHYRAGDLIVVEGAVEVNRLRCYARQAGIHTIDVRTTVDAFTHDLHMSHQAALADTDIIAEAPEMYSRTQRLWRAGSARVATAPPEDMKTILEHTFEGGGGTRYILILHARPSTGAIRIPILRRLR